MTCNPNAMERAMGTCLRLFAEWRQNCHSTAFEYADETGKGELSKHQYKIAMTVLFGFTPDKFETRQIFQGGSKSGINFEEFLTWVLKKGYRDEVDAQTLFVLLDRDFKGHVDIWDFYSATESTDLRVSKSIWRKVFQEIDQRKKGFLGLEDLKLFVNVERG